MKIPSGLSRFMPQKELAYFFGKDLAILCSCCGLCREQGQGQTKNINDRERSLYRGVATVLGDFVPMPLFNTYYSIVYKTFHKLQKTNTFYILLFSIIN